MKQINPRKTYKKLCELIRLDIKAQERENAKLIKQIALAREQLFAKNYTLLELILNE